MNVLMVTAYPPVLHRHGGGVRMYHNIRILSQRHSVHVLSFVGSDEEQEALASVRAVCESIRGIRRIPDFRPHWLSITPFMVREFSTPEMHQAVDGMLRAKKIDVVQCEYLQMAQFRRDRVFSLLTVHEALAKNAHDAFMVESAPAAKLKLFYRWMQMLHYEVSQVRCFDRVITMTELDARYLRSYAPAARIRAIPIGIDPEEFAPAAGAADDMSRGVEVLFIGNFFHAPNVEAAHFLVEQVAPRLPDVKFVIPGSPVPEGLRAGANVSFPGYAPDTRTLHRSSSTIVAAPLFSGTGQRVKLLEAFSMACPVVTTDIGAMGYPIENGVQAILAHTVDEYVAAIRRLASDGALRRRLGAQGREMIVNRFSWDRIGEELLDVVAEAAVSR